MEPMLSYEEDDDLDPGQTGILNLFLSRATGTLERFFEAHVNEDWMKPLEEEAGALCEDAESRKQGLASFLKQVDALKGQSPQEPKASPTSFVDSDMADLWMADGSILCADGTEAEQQVEEQETDDEERDIITQELQSTPEEKGEGGITSGSEEEDGIVDEETQKLFQRESSQSVREMFTNKGDGNGRKKRALIPPEQEEEQSKRRKSTSSPPFSPQTTASPSSSKGAFSPASNTGSRGHGGGASSSSPKDAPTPENSSSSRGRGGRSKLCGKNGCKRPRGIYEYCHLHRDNDER